MEVMEVTEPLRDLIKISRLQTAKLSQRRAAGQAGITATWWRNLETGRATTASLETVAAMCHSAKVRPGNLDTIGFPRLATEVRKRNALLDGGEKYPGSSGADYILAAPEHVFPPVVKRALLAYLNSLQAMAADTDELEHRLVGELQAWEKGTHKHDRSDS